VKSFIYNRVKNWKRSEYQSPKIAQDMKKKDKLFILARQDTKTPRSKEDRNPY